MTRLEALEKILEFLTKERDFRNDMADEYEFKNTRKKSSYYADQAFINRNKAIDLCDLIDVCLEITEEERVKEMANGEHEAR